MNYEQARGHVALGFFGLAVGLVLLSCYGLSLFTLLVFGLSGIGLYAITSPSIEEKRSQSIGIGLVISAITLFVVAIVSMADSDKHPSQQLLDGLLAQSISVPLFFFLGIISGGLALFTLFPPAMGMVWESVMGTIDPDSKADNSGGFVSRMSGGSNNRGEPMISLGLDNNSSGDITDDLIRSLINSDSSLQSLFGANPDLVGKIQTTFDYYNPNEGVFSSWAQRMRGEGRTKLLKVLNEEQQQLINQAAMLEGQALKGQKERAEYQLFLAKNAFDLIALKGQAEQDRELFSFEK